MCQEENSQGLVEYTFVVMFIALVFWLGVKDSAVGDSLAKNWAKVHDCVLRRFRAPPTRRVLAQTLRPL